MTVAVTALAGCVTVQRPPAAGPPAGVPHPTVPHLDGRARTQVVQAPAREALEMIAPSRPTEPPASPAHRATPAASAPTPAPERTAPPEARDRRTAPARPATGRTPPPKRPAPHASGASEKVRRDMREQADVCALGRKYGRWQADSPQSAICEQAYGR
ncbi:hypothetical protein ACFYY3_30960 [Streptomyces sp. NPDC001812]|uniref:hypothetical protein n=1 Tax=Streptomyces sp. NPDC001812 TaxID=3364611 RepID=UPI00369B2597